MRFLYYLCGCDPIEIGYFFSLFKWLFLTSQSYSVRHNN
ncbi:unnamed protein product [Schistosoma mattheei]|uniref:Uncharacterized protein n=1 Tax=Schistosoma mattheei TaxID=31246 RepID=A0A183PLB7_9TREM|nr:unnamed protein product [Schistosoma mattheei]